MGAYRIVGGCLLALALPVGLIVGCAHSGAAGAHGPGAVGSSSAAPSGSLEIPAVGQAADIALDLSTPACAISVRTSPGSTYRPESSQLEAVRQTLTQALKGCLDRGPTLQGTAHVRAEVSAQGELSSVIVSPGGAFASELGACFSQRLDKLRVAGSQDGPSTLLLFFVSGCKGS